MEPTKDAVVDPTPAPVPEPKKDTEIDYKAKLAEITAAKQAAEDQLKKAEHTIIKLKKDKDGEEDKDKEATPAIDVETIVSQVTEKLNQNFERVKADLAGNVVDDMIASVSSNPDERALIKEIYSSKIVKGGLTREAIMNDIRTAKIIANTDKITKALPEIAYARTASAGMGGGSPSSHDVTAPAEELSKAEIAQLQAIAKRQNKSFDVVKAQYLKNR